MENTGSYVLFFDQIDKNSLPYVGGKGANLGEMTRAGFPVPQGFCVTTSAYQAFLTTSNEMDHLFDRLDQLDADQLEEIRNVGQQLRDHLESMPIPQEIEAAISSAWTRSGEGKAYAVRSSATAEDLPSASFAGQQDTYLNVCGYEQLLDSIRRCWASLFTDRAISYRAKNGFNHRHVFLSVVVQEMVFPDVSGILFTADPISGNRHVVSIDASFGLGEALVSGLVSADLYQVRDGHILQKKISNKKIAIYTVPTGGTVTKDLPPEQQEAQALPDAQILELARLGKKIEAHYGSEQDIEWCSANGQFYIVQSRPITSLYPVPKFSDDRFHVMVSVGHIQMMTDVMKPIAISVFQTIFRFGTKDGFAHEAGGRVFADATPLLSLRPLRKRIPRVLNMMDERMSNAVLEVLDRERAAIPLKPLPVGKIFSFALPIAKTVVKNLLFRDPALGAVTVAEITEQSLQKCKQNVWDVPSTERIRGVLKDLREIPIVIPKIIPNTMSGVLAGSFIRNLLQKWGGDTEKLHVLNLSFPGNVTSEMGLMIGDLADLARQNDPLIAYLETATDDHFYEGLKQIPGAEPFRQELERFMSLYGMRCPGEIDVSRPRWRETPTALVPALLSHIKTVGPGEHRVKFEQGAREAEAAAREIIAQIRATKGSFKAKILSRLIRVYRQYGGLRENHKYLLIRHFDQYKQAILEVGRMLVGKGVLAHETDVFYLTLDELASFEEQAFSQDTHERIQTLIEERKKQEEHNRKRTPPRVMTSEGEVIAGRRQDVQVPEGALVGTAVSNGVVEGYARIVLRPEEAKLNPGEIMIAPFTDPGWTPLFHSAKGLITEIGGMMTHGSVVAREYGIPAVVGIENATQLIHDGDYIRIDGSQGYVQILRDHE